MGVLSYIVHPVRSIGRNRRRSLFAVIGIVLSISFISGTFIAIDSSTGSLVSAALRYQTYDYSGYMNVVEMNATHAQDTAAALENLQYVEVVAPIIYYSGWDFGRPGEEIRYSFDYWGSGTAIGFLLNDSADALERSGVNGSMPGRGTVAISDSVADRLGLGVGDDINLSARISTISYGNFTETVGVEYVNLTFEISGVWSTWVASTGTEYSDIVVGGEAFSAVLDYRDAAWIDERVAEVQNVSFGAYPMGVYEVWIDRGAVISPGDLPGTLERLTEIEKRLTLVGYSHDVSGFYGYLRSTLAPLGDQMNSYKTLFFALSVPVMLLGAYLSVVGIDLATSDRRREIGILKARGGTVRQILGEMMVEAAILGAAAGILGLMGGIFMSRTLLDLMPTTMGAPAGTVDLGDFSVSAETLLATIILGVILMMAISYGPMKRIVKTDVAEALHFFSPTEARKEYHALPDITALALSVVCVFSVIATAQGWFESSYSSFLFQILVIITLLLGIGLTPMLPLLLTVSVTRLLTRGPRRIYTKFAALMKPWTKGVHYLIEVNIGTNPKRSSMMCMIIALAVAFGLFVSVTAESTMEYEITRVRNMVGAEMNAVGYVSSHESNRIHALDDLSSLPGVDSVTRFYSLGTEQSSNYYTLDVTVIDASEYSDLVHPPDYWFPEANAAKLLDLEENGTALVSSDTANGYGIREGDTLPLNLKFYRQNQSELEVNLDLYIIGIVNGLPGISGSVYIDRGTLGYVSDDTLVNTTVWENVGVLLNLGDGANHTAVGESVQNTMEEAGLGMSGLMDLDVLIEQTKRSPSYGSFAMFFGSEYAFSMAMMTFGVTLIIFVTVGERQRELACMMARGASGKQVGKILMGESGTLMIIGLLIGTAVGLLTAYLFNELTAALSNQIGHPLVLTFTSVSILVIAIISMLAAMFLTVVWTGKIRLSEILRVRGG